MKKLFIFCFVTLLSLVNTETIATQEFTQEPTTFTEQVKSIQKSNVKYYQSDNKTNQIPYFDNRFRIDAKLDEITLLFYRNRGSRPIILVRPDGSKLRVDNVDKSKVQWHDDSTFDLIRIEKPMPGPWQAIGDIMPESQIMVMSDVKIEVEPLPEVVLSGETIKVVGKLYNGDEPINTPHFRNVVKLDVHFYSTNNTDYENFGASALKLTSFRDDGHNLDEYAADGLFTGEFRLDFAAGEWQPVFLIKLPMASRELRQKPLVLHKSPITIAVETSENENNPHSMTLSINPTYVDPNSLVFQGKITFPDKQIEPFSIMDDQQGDTRIKDIENTESGIYRINVSAFGKTTSGREFRLTVPEFSFNVKPSDDEYLMITTDENGVEQTVSIDREQKLLADREAELAQAKIVRQQAEEEKEMQTMIMIAAGNGGIIVIALVLFFVMRKKKK
ncbi:TIGR03503 family protein [Candidatus Colwellia aromaticivorans]|uniref:TIGR03503 family protein n=1 Tax=Candidatus Colwellia aromaticivorans TaxID=2267621 RepID=UPI000DF142D9|nr:TIGR03503 family protein [Candidatus Colwellia aromaticivorans]